MSIVVTYELRVHSPQEIDAMARKIAVEQTLEVPEALITEHDVESLVGKVEDVEPLGENRYRVNIAYPETSASGQLPQLLNLLFGNVLILPEVRVVGIELPESLLGLFPGPAYGVTGLRGKLGVSGRPLLATALKPRGVSNEKLAQTAHDFVLGGGDLIKDDHNLVDDSLDQFLDRARSCQNAVEEASARTGSTAIYLPFLCRPYEELDEAIARLQSAGVGGLLVAPMILGLDFTRALARRSDFVLMSHPSFSGSYYVASEHGIGHELVLGTLFRMAGVDISVFPNAGGRFRFTREDCHRVSDALRAPLGSVKRSFPAPAGGMAPDRFLDMKESYGVDTVYLVGGALLGHSADLTDSTRHFRNLLEEQFGA